MTTRPHHSSSPLAGEVGAKRRVGGMAPPAPPTRNVARRLATFLPSPSRGEGKVRLFLFVISFATLAVPAFAANLAGYWYGEGYQPLWHENAQWLMHLSPDGVYAIEFRDYRDCRLVREQKETGTWNLTHGFRTVTTTVNGRPTRYENDYNVGALTENEFRITQTVTGQHYVERRVAPNFTMIPPTCPTS